MSQIQSESSGSGEGHCPPGPALYGDVRVMVLWGSPCPLLAQVALALVQPMKSELRNSKHFPSEY